MLLRMLIDLYGQIQLDATYGVPIATLSEVAPKEYPARKIFEIGVHAIWAIRVSDSKLASGRWTGRHRDASKKGEEWADFWGRVSTLERIGALWYEPWVFDNDRNDAEPLFPVDFSALYQFKEGDEQYQLTRPRSKPRERWRTSAPMLWIGTRRIFWCLWRFTGKLRAYEA